MKKVIAGLFSIGLLLGGVACDDADKAGRHCGPVDSDDCRLGPGDGVDEPGPLR